MTKEGYAICFNQWLFDNEIKNDLHILLLISSLCASEGFCFASNSYFANKFKIDEATVSRKIKKLEKLGHISITYIKRGSEVIKREIRLTKISSDCTKCQRSIDENVNRTIDENVNRTIDENVKDNNTSINNTSINKKEIYKEKEKNSQKKLDPYCNPYKIFLIDEYEKVFGNRPKLSNFNCNRIIELASENEDFKEILPTALKKMKDIDWKKINFTPSVQWLLKDDHFYSLLNGEFDNKEAEFERMMAEWRKR